MATKDDTSDDTSEAVPPLPLLRRSEKKVNNNFAKKRRTNRKSFFVRTQHQDHPTITITTVGRATTIRSVKAKVERVLRMGGVDMTQFCQSRLVYLGKQLGDDKTLADYYIQDGSTLDFHCNFESSSEPSIMLTSPVTSSPSLTSQTQPSPSTVSQKNVVSLMPASTSAHVSAIQANTLSKASLSLPIGSALPTHLPSAMPCDAKLCELCNSLVPHHVTFHIKESHPGCNKSASGWGYNESGSYTRLSFSGNCGDGGSAENTHYLMCPDCHSVYLAQKRAKIASHKVSSSSFSRRVPIKIFIVTVTGETIHIAVHFFNDIKWIKSQAKFWSTERFPVCYEQQLTFGDKVLEDRYHLDHYGITDGSTLHLKWAEMVVFVESLGESTELIFEPTDTIANVKAEIEGKKGLPHEEQLLTFNEIQLEDDYDLIHYEVTNGSSVHFKHQVKITVETLRGCSITVAASPADTIDEIKSDIRKKERLPNHHLYLAGKILQNDKSLSHYNISQNSILQLSRYAITLNTEEMKCSQCSNVTIPGDGVRLSNCSHEVCWSCLHEIAINTGYCNLCTLKVSSEEISTILTDEELAVKDLPYRFYCKTTDCFGSCFIEDKCDEFCCYSCGNTNCIPCLMQHEGMNCKQYQDNVHDIGVQNLKSLEVEGKAFHCPGCDIIISKKFGCTWSGCRMCEMEICWDAKLLESQMQGNEQKNFRRLSVCYDDLLTVSMTHRQKIADLNAQKKEAETAYGNLLTNNQQLTASLQQKESNLKQTVNMQEEEIEQLMLQQLQQREVVAKLQESIRKQDQIIKQKDALEGDLLQQIDKLEQALKQKKEELVEQNEDLQIVIKKKEDELQQTIQQKEEQRNVFDRRLEVLQQNLHDFERREETMRRENFELEERLRDVSSSRNDRKTPSTSSWKISRKDIEVRLSEELGRGAWGVVYKGMFRGQSVAVKQIHELIRSQTYLEALNQEINVMANLRHPNLLQFIGAVLDGPPMIVTEVMDMSLRDAYEKKVLTPDPSCRPVILSIMRDVAVGLNYLHSLPEPIIHRDLSSSNVLLESKGPRRWKTKISDFGSAKKVRLAVTKAPGAQVYSAPEALLDITRSDPKKQTTRMDVFSYGILLCEVLTCRFPGDHPFKEMRQEIRLDTSGGSSLSRFFSKNQTLYSLVELCTKIEPHKRPTMNQVINNLDDIEKRKGYMK